MRRQIYTYRDEEANGDLEEALKSNALLIDSTRPYTEEEMAQFAVNWVRSLASDKPVWFPDLVVQYFAPEFDLDDTLMASLNGMYDFAVCVPHLSAKLPEPYRSAAESYYLEWEMLLL